MGADQGAQSGLGRDEIALYAIEFRHAETSRQGLLTAPGRLPEGFACVAVPSLPEKRKPQKVKSLGIPWIRIVPREAFHGTLEISFGFTVVLEPDLVSSYGGKTGSVSRIDSEPGLPVGGRFHERVAVLIDMEPGEVAGLRALELLERGIVPARFGHERRVGPEDVIEHDPPIPVPDADEAVGLGNLGGERKVEETGDCCLEPCGEG
jgi:hypothetical protein